MQLLILFLFAVFILAGTAGHPRLKSPLVVLIASMVVAVGYLSLRVLG